MQNKVQVWYIDAPWFYNQRCTHSKTKFGGGVSVQYPTMRDSELLDICDYIQANSADDAVMFSWITAPRALLGFYFILRCGFRLATKAFTWEKITKDGSPATGPGAYTASNTEDVILGQRAPELYVPNTFDEWQEYIQNHPEALEEMQDCYLGVRGSFTPDTVGGQRMVQQVIRAPRGVHSAKPDEAYRRIERMYPNAVKCELFARKRRPGWISLGNELSGMDIRASLSEPFADEELTESQQQLLDEALVQWVQLADSGIPVWHIQQLLLK